MPNSSLASTKKKPRVDLSPVSSEACAEMARNWPHPLHGKCRRRACEHPCKAKGGYCPCCFERRMAPWDTRPEVVVLCGSTRFSEAWAQARYDLTLAGKIVLTIGCDTKSDDGLGLTTEQKFELDELHKRKIDIANRILVLNVGGYIGESTRSEIEYAEWFEKPVEYLEPPDGVRRNGQASTMDVGALGRSHENQWPYPSPRPPNPPEAMPSVSDMSPGTAEQERDIRFAPGNDAVRGEGNWVRCSDCPHDAMGQPVYHHKDYHA